MTRHVARSIAAAIALVLLGVLMAFLPMPPWSEWAVRAMCWLLAIVAVVQFTARLDKAWPLGRLGVVAVPSLLLGALLVMTPLGWGTSSVALVLAVVALVLKGRMTNQKDPL